MKALIQLAAGAAVGLVAGAVLLAASALIDCKPLPAQTAPQALTAAECIGADIAKGIDDPAVILNDCEGATSALIGDVVKTFDKTSPSLRLKLAAGDGGVK